MKDTTTPRTVYLNDYSEPDYWITNVYLTFDLHETKTKVSSKLKVKRHDKNVVEPLKLHGENLTLLKVSLDGKEIDDNLYQVKDDILLIHGTEKLNEFFLEIENEVNPKENKALEGLYKSGEMFCTQNEPEGFRKITYYLDRSDVMAIFTTKIIADKLHYPILLSNGNLIERGDLEDGKHFAIWEDPFKKPSYLFALVAGDLGVIKDKYTSMSGRLIDLYIYVDKGNEAKAHHAMKSLKKSMQWDEQVYGLEYDLDIYMIVAVDDFNMGAMENKGLNIFNSSLVLANSTTATDDDFEAIESVVGHEYFHNWTGNRVTCRDWFQLTLKEGLTVFRDQEFSSDMNSRSVQRIKDVKVIRSSSFVEDDGPMAHPIRPSSYIEINNFYTVTVYCKGAEVIRMVHSLIGKDLFRKGIDKYFELYDGKAVTTDDFIYAMHLASGYDFSSFMNWYNQAGVPEVTISKNYDPDKKELKLKFSQKTNPTPGQKEKKPFSFPFGIGLIDSSGKELNYVLSKGQKSNHHLVVEGDFQEFVLSQVQENPILSLNRNFSAPVRVNYEHSDSELACLLSHDKDDFNRWDAGQEFAKKIIDSAIENKKFDDQDESVIKYVDAIKKCIQDASVDASLRALALSLPDIGLIIQNQNPIDFETTFHVLESFRKKIATDLKQELLNTYQVNEVKGEYRFTPEDTGKRSLRNIILFYLSYTNENELVYEHFKSAHNMTDEISALSILCHLDCKEKDMAVDHFYEKWSQDKLVMNKWISVQAASKLPTTFDRVVQLTQHPVFDIENPNKLRALIRGFFTTPTNFHHDSGRGYEFLKDIIIKVDKFNPSMSSNLAGGYKLYKKLDSKRMEIMKNCLGEILKEPKLSKNTFEVISKTLNS